MSKRKVYVVWVGAYDDRDIDSIWSTRDAAEKRAASEALAHWTDYESPCVIEMALDPADPEGGAAE